MVSKHQFSFSTKKATMHDIPESITNNIKISVVELLKPKDELKAEVKGKCSFNSFMIRNFFTNSVTADVFF